MHQLQASSCKYMEIERYLPTRIDLIVFECQCRMPSYDRTTRTIRDLRNPYIVLSRSLRKVDQVVMGQRCRSLAQFRCATRLLLQLDEVVDSVQVEEEARQARKKQRRQQAQRSVPVPEADDSTGVPQRPVPERPVQEVSTIPAYPWCAEDNSDRLGIFVCVA